MFADLVGATALSGELDPETLRAVLRDYQRICIESVSRYGGKIHQYAGDGVLAYFGYPIAHDNEAERAARAGLAIVAGLRALTEERRARAEPGISVRVGIHTGLVVIGEMGDGSAREVHAIGDTPNVAARIQAEAAPGAVCISAETRRLAGPRIQSRALGACSLKGVARPMELFAVEGVLDAAASPGRDSTAPLVGRDTELRQIMERWELTKSSRGQAVLLSGEGGIGKSRLLAEFRHRADLPPSAWRNVFCSPFYQNSALQPMIDLIERALGHANAGLGADKATALRDALQASGLTDETTFGLMAALLGLPDEHQQAVRDLAPDQRRRRTMDALIEWLRADSRHHPLVLVAEDLHWIDASTQALLGMVLERIADFPILAIMTFRPEFVPAWALHGHVTMLALTRLAASQVESVATNVTGGRPLPASIIEEIARRTDGVPLFVEEMTKAIIASQLVVERDGAFVVHGAAAASLEIPTTLRDSLTARLDRLGPAKLVAQLGSVLGREFDYAVLHAVSDLPEAQLEEMLDELNRAEIIHQRGVPPRSHYIFKHALIQEAAYDTLLRSTRQAHHRRVATAYERRFPEVARSHPELVAHHYSRALMAREALAFWQRAGELAVARSGYTEAIAHLNAALQQLELLPDSEERAATELGLRVKIGPAVAAMKGFSSRETGDNYDRACRLAVTLSERPEQFMAMWGDWLYKTTTAQLEAAARRSDDLVELSRRLGDEDYVLQAHHSRWTNFFGLGDARISRADTLEGIRLYNSERHRNHRHIYGGHDPGVCALGVGANTAWLTGRVQEALELANRGIALGRELDHPFSLVLAHYWATVAFYSAGEYDRARASSEEVLAISERQGFRQWNGLCTVILGLAKAAEGSTAFGLKMVEEGLAAHRSFGHASLYPMVAVAAAKSHRHDGNHARALELLAEAIEQARNQRVGWLAPEMDRLYAETLLQTERIAVHEAIARVEQASTLAEAQSAALLQWRAKILLAQLLVDSGRTPEARTHLLAVASISGDGLDAPEIADAGRLLALI